MLKTYTYASTKHGPRVRINGEIVCTQTVVTELCTLRAALVTARNLIGAPTASTATQIARINKALD